MASRILILELPHIEVCGSHCILSGTGLQLTMLLKRPVHEGGHSPPSGSEIKPT